MVQCEWFLPSGRCASQAAATPANDEVADERVVAPKSTTATKLAKRSVLQADQDSWDESSVDAFVVGASRTYICLFLLGEEPTSSFAPWFLGQWLCIYQ